MTGLAAIGEVVAASRVNLRQGAANTHVPVVRTVDPGTKLSVLAVVIGESIGGNAHWYLLADDVFVWAGGCDPFKPAPATAPPQAPGTVVEVVDLYHGDRVDSFAEAKAHGVLAVIHKATTGATGHDTLYAARRKDARDAGLLWGAYHWGTAAPVADQVKNFLAVAEPDADTLIALDYEKDVGNQMTLDGARAFLQGIQDKLGRRAVLYSANTVKEALGTKKDAFFGSHRLWLAQYGTQPKVQASWTTFWLWQYTDGTSGPDPKKVPGIPGNTLGQVDCDHYLGTPEQLRAEWAS